MALEMCRSCLATGGALQLSVQHENYKQCFMDLAGIIVKEKDGLPQSICQECAGLFSQFADFRAKVIRSHEFLLDALERKEVPNDQLAPVGIVNKYIPNSLKEEFPDYPQVELLDNEHSTGFDLDTLEVFEQAVGKKRKKNKEKKKDKSKKSQLMLKCPRVLIKVDETKITTIRLSKEEQIQRHESEGANPAYLSMPHRCEKCYKGFNYERKLTAHAEKYHKVTGDYRCDVCHRTLLNAPSLALHLARHDTLYECRVCLQRYVEKKQAVVHYRREHEGVQTDVLCKYCGMTFRHRSTLNGHIRSHHPQTDRPTCDVCAKSFVSKDSLLDHLLIHSGEKNYACPTCGKRFRMKSEVKVHARTHTDAKPFYCLACDKQFKTSTSYNNHRRLARAHVSQDILQRHTCSECGRSFGSGSSLRAHTDTHTGARHECAHCGLKLSSRAAVNKHVRVTHLKIPPPKNHVCHACGKRFSGRLMLENHIRVHTGEKPFVCSHAECGARFTQKSTLHSHVRLTHLKLKRNVAASDT